MPKGSQRTIAKVNNTTTEYNLEEMIKYIRQNPNAALDVHNHLTQITHLQHLNINAPMESSTPQTPKRNLDVSDSDGTQILKQQRVLSNGKQKGSGRINSSIATNSIRTLNNNPESDQWQQQTTEQQQNQLSFDQLKRAVSSNLPCFLIEYDQEANAKKRPSDLAAASSIEEHFKHQGIMIKFSLVGHVGNKLKLGVNDKKSYASLLSTEKWPSQVNNVNITVIKPKYIPDSFALVARYIPLQYNDEYVKEEIERNLQSAENIRRIQYRYQRKTNDFRFIVKDLNEYNSALKLGRISIGNTFCTITTFLSGNRMTYCTRCWCLGHMRDKCKLEHTRCRICLNIITDSQTHVCSNIARCAQCHGDHHSLSSTCEKVIEYRTQLNEQVNNALSTGKLHRLTPQDHSQPTQIKINQNEFPALPDQVKGATPWKRASEQTTTIAIMKDNEDTTRMLSMINQNMLDMKENTQRINEKLDRMNDIVEQTVHDTELHHVTLLKILPTLVSIVGDFIWPLMSLNLAGLGEKQPQLQKLFTNLNTSLSNLTADYANRRKRSSSPPPQLSPSQEPSDVANQSLNNETVQNMSK